MRSFWSTAELKARGRSDRAIASAVRAGQLLVVRPGRFAVPSADPELVRAVRVGGVATANTASRAMGLWTPPDARPRPSPTGLAVVHAAVPGTASLARLRDPDDPALPLVDRADVVRHWTEASIVRAGRAEGMVGVQPMLRDLFRTEPPERALAVVDSALRSRHLRESELPALAAILPVRLRPVVEAADARAQSGTETIARHLLRLRGLRVEPQAHIDGVGDVDLLVEGRLVLETDGREWHDDAEAFARDRRRDLVAATGRYRVLRFTWFQVLFQWAEVEAAVLAALAS